MASKDRILRLKEVTRKNILEASMCIVKKEGWQALNMRGIADVIEYTAPVIYEYFANKEAIILELVRGGFILLSEKLQSAKRKHRLPAKQIESMWLSYWEFAFENKELYKAMFGVNTNCCSQLVNYLPEAQIQCDLFKAVIGHFMEINDLDSDVVYTKYYTFWSVVHGLISINILRRGASDAINRQVLKDAIFGIMRSITEQRAKSAVSA